MLWLYSIDSQYVNTTHSHYKKRYHYIHTLYNGKVWSVCESCPFVPCLIDFLSQSTKVTTDGVGKLIKNGMNFSTSSFERNRLPHLSKLSTLSISYHYSNSDSNVHTLEYLTNCYCACRALSPRMSGIGFQRNI